MFWVQILYQIWDMQIVPPSVWLVFLLMMQFGAQKFGILMKSPSSVAFMNEFLSGCCLSPKCWHGCFGQFGPALELCFAERIYRPLVPSRHSESPLVHIFYSLFHMRKLRRGWDRGETVAVVWTQVAWLQDPCPESLGSVLPGPCYGNADGEPAVSGSCAKGVRSVSVTRQPPLWLWANGWASKG